MPPDTNLFFIAAGTAIIAWTLINIVFLTRSLPVSKIESELPSKISSKPKVSLIIAARNEEKTLKEALSSHIISNYPNREIIVVNDRSTDGTEKIIEFFCQRYPYFKTLTLNETPPGWFGKAYALHRAMDLATGDYILFTDADVHLSPDTLSKVVALCETNEIDHLSIFPRIICKSFALGISMVLLAKFILILFNLSGVNKQKAKCFFGIGAFNFVRRSFFDRTPGFRWLKLEIADDVSLAHLLSNNGAKKQAFVSDSAVSIEWYPSLKAMVEGFSKNLFGLFCGYSYAKCLVLCVFAITLPSSIAIIYYSTITGQLPTWMTLLVIFNCLCDVYLSRKLRYPLSHALLSFFGGFTFSYIFIKSAYLCWKSGKIEWGAISQEINDLKKEQKLKIHG